MRRVEIGQDNVQGIDYTYTINGWLKAINNPSLEPTLDPGRDGRSGSSEVHALFGRDAFGMFLAYHTDDFKHTGSYADAADTAESSNTWHQAPLSSLYNGNIGAWQWGSRTSTGYKEILASRYRYDLLNRIRVDTLSTRVSNAWTATPNCRSSYTYDGNGNLKSLVRVDSAGTLMDSLVYRYQTNRNRLTHVDDPGGVAGNHSFDVDDQDTNTYTYDASGNMIGDTASGITAIVWTPSNKIQSMTKGSTSKLEYTYDAMGNRVVKRYYQPTSTLKSTTWYARDAQGNILSVYERPHADSAIKQSEVHIYGSSRLGIEQRGITYGTSNYAWIGSEQHRNAGSKRYELTDHLGNVRVTISDLLIARPTGFGDTTQDAEVIDRRDYYPFGMEMPGRRWRASGEDAARFGFNGKENDNEVKGEGNQQDYGFRIYDPRIARFLSVDPLTREFPWLTPYQFSSNTPVWALDLDGLEAVVYTETDDRLGHTFIEVLDEKGTVWSYGRYAGTSSQLPGAQSLSPVGPGVLIKYQGDKAAKYISERLQKHSATAFLIPSAGADEINRFLEAKFERGRTLPVDHPLYNDGRIIDTYNVLTNNCATLVTSALKAGGFDLSSQSWPVQHPPLKAPLMVEGALQKIVSDDTNTSRSKLLPAVPDGEVQRVYDVTKDSEARVDEVLKDAEQDKQK